MSDFTRRVLARLQSTFPLNKLQDALQFELLKVDQAHGEMGEDQLRAQSIWMLARSNYEVHSPPGKPSLNASSFRRRPRSATELRMPAFVRFRKDDGTFAYYATFTAYDGRVIMPELLETADFSLFRFNSLNGPEAENKGMALFPRKVNGAYTMLSRQDNENIYLMVSDNMHFWNERRLLLKPRFPWELVQLGNCGRPSRPRPGGLC